MRDMISMCLYKGSETTPSDLLSNNLFIEGYCSRVSHQTNVIRQDTPPVNYNQMNNGGLNLPVFSCSLPTAIYSIHYCYTKVWHMKLKQQETALIQHMSG